MTADPTCRIIHPISIKFLSPFLLSTSASWSWDSSVGVGLDYRLDDIGIVVGFKSGARYISVIQKRLDRL
jgi:hypothetical protein